MIDRIRAYLPEGYSDRELLIASVAISITLSIISLGIVTWVLVKLPSDYFIQTERAPLIRNRYLKIPWIIFRNIFGYLIIILGIIMALPGVPGQGLITILIGTLLVDFPGKKRCERWILKRPRVRYHINRIRARFGQPELQLDIAQGNP